MALVIRRNKGEPLTYAELDGNFSFLNSEIISLSNTVVEVQAGQNFTENFIANIRNLFTSSGDLQYNPSTGQFTISGAVTSINGQQGDLVLDSDDISEGTNNLYHTEQRVIDTLNTKLRIGPGLTLVNDSVLGPQLGVNNFTIRLAGGVSGSGVVDSLGNVVIDTTVSDVTGASGIVAASADSESSAISGITITSSGNIEPGLFTGIEFVGSDFDVTDNGESVSVSLAQSLSPAGITNTVGGFMSGSVFDDDLSQYTESGIIVTNDTSNGNIRISPRDFLLTFTGAATGSATISRLKDTVIELENSNNYIDGVDLQLSGTPINSEPQTVLNFDRDYFTLTSATNVSTISLNGLLTASDVRDIVGDFVVGTSRDVDLNTQTETGIIVNYDAENNALEVAPRDFTITIDGAVSGSATISRLQDVTITTANDNNYIDGLVVKEDTVQVSSSPITSLDFDSNYFSITVDGSETNVSLNGILAASDVRDIVGDFVVGTERDINTNAQTETGIIVNYDQENNVLEVAPRDFDITLTGAITGTGTISRLQDLTITTTSNAIEGIDIERNAVPIQSAVTKLDFSESFSVSYDEVNDKIAIGITSEIDPEDIRATIGNANTGAQDGILIAYDSAESQYSYQLSDLAITLDGAVTGTATLSYDGTGTQNLTITTATGNLGSGVEIRDEGDTRGQSISAINFVGAGVTSSVTVDGQVATVFIPNSPGNEKFLLLDNGSANVPNARRLTAGTGIVINDAGAGNDVTISASGGEVLGKIQVQDDTVLVGEQAAVNFESSQTIFTNAENDTGNNRIDVYFYSKLDGWWRNTAITHGDITDKYGNSLDLGDLAVGIIEHQINFGDIA